VRVVLVAHAATEDSRAAAFPAADAPSARLELGRAGLATAALPRADLVLHGPAPRCADTAAALGLHARPDEGLRGPDYGSWTGRALDELAAAQPGALGAWLADPDARPHGGESLTALVGRIGRWLDGQAARDAHVVLAVVDPAVARAAVAYAVGAGGAAVRRFDVGPLGQVVLSGGPGRWSLRSLRAGAD
jgi:broad specificity phosphatase PhoE